MIAYDAYAQDFVATGFGQYLDKAVGIAIGYCPIQIGDVVGAGFVFDA